ncbi:acyl-CoA dehydrogenase family protein [Rhodococcoides kyotonense]|uniref:Acyl-CoA dehydrogenase n=1 Tax=Rhodococcoides kyotonense TaxID=398843 RepID=A0A239H8V6_9NOCA|nr:acyl-CoA dehydrogenase family protein [Rhodococcus kyotonensis]SNS77866.1 acyl-CoA dehydrogenase [Rhodococcus kyotonensis]
MAPSTITIEAPRPRFEPAALTPGDEQAGIRDAVRGIFAKYATVEQIRTVSQTPLGYSSEQWTRLVDDMSVTTLAAPEDQGGLGYGMVELGIILEECGRSLSPEPVYSSAVLGVQAFLHAPTHTDEARKKLLDGSAVAAVSTLTTEGDRILARKTESGWILDGESHNVVGGSGADVVVVSAQYEDGVGVFALETERHVDARPRTVLDPTRRQADLTVTQSPAILLASAEHSATYIAHLRDLSTLALASENTGIADAVLDMTVEYVKTRSQFGRPIGSFQAVKHRLADVLIELERARSAARYAAAVYDGRPDDAHLAIAVAGAVCIDAALHAVHEAVQLHGGVGFTWEHPAHSYLRRALGNEAIQGDSRTHRARIADLVAL